MSKGFSAPDPRVQVFTRRLVNALNSLDEDRANAVLTWGARNLGEKALTSVCVQIHHDSTLPGLTDEGAEFYWDIITANLKNSPYWDEAKSKAMECVVETLREQNFVIGKDFSFGPKGELIMNDDVTQAVLEMLPERDREKFRREYLQHNKQPLDLKAIAVNVGVNPDYFDRFFAIAKRRLAPYVMRDDGYFVLNYVFNFLEGTNLKFPELTDSNFDGYTLSQVASPEAMKRILAKGDDYPEPPEKEEGAALEALWKDMAEATGKAEGNEFSEVEGIGGVMSIHAFKLIGKVWESEKTPMREMVGLLEKHSRQK